MTAPTTDFYSECETGAMRQVRTLTTLFKNDWQVSDDDTVIAKGAENFFIVRPGQFPYTSQTAVIKDVSWHVTADLYIKFVNYKTSWSKFKVCRSAIINLLMSDPTLGNTSNVFRVGVSSQENAQYFSFDEPKHGVKPNFIIQTLDVEIIQRVRFE
jgi:hypothetical protein